MSCSHLKLVKLFISVALIVFWSSCRSDDPEYDVPESPALVTLSVSAARSGPSSRVALPPADQDKISSVYVLQFTSGSGGGAIANEKLVYVAEGKWNGTKRKYEATLLKSADSRDLYRVVILANIDGGFLYTLYGNTYGEIQQRCLSGTISGGPLSFDPAVGIPLFGVARRNVPFEVGAGTDIGEVQLLRSVARVDVGIGLYNGTSEEWDRNGVDFNMTDIQVWKAGQRYAWMPLADNYSYNETGYPSVGAASPVAGDLSASPWVYAGGDISSSLYCRNTVFLPEAALSGHVFDADHTNRPAIIVGGHYPASSATKSWYRIDFTTSATSSSATSIDLDILRNHLYRFTVTKVTAKGYASAEDAYLKKPVGLGFTAGVKPWIDGISNGTPTPITGVRMFYQLNAGRRPSSNVTGELYEKASAWRGRFDYQYGVSGMPFDYNDFYGEGTNFYYPYDGVGSNNGDIYYYGTVNESTEIHKLRFSALWVEGVYPALMIARNDLVDAGHSDGQFPWRAEDGSLSAFDACRAYEGEGYTDWRLPRLSELALMYVYKDKLKEEYPAAVFSFPEGTYWSGNECADLPSGMITGTGASAVYDYSLGVKSSSKAWAFNFSSSGTHLGAAFENPRPLKSAKRKVRCVRQIGGGDSKRPE